MRDPATKTVELTRDAIAGFSPSNCSAKTSIAKWLTEERAGGMLCRCGDFACHRAIHCKRCGGEFVQVKATTRENLIRKKADYRGREAAVRWFVALDYRLIRDAYGVNETEEMMRHIVAHIIWPNSEIRQAGPETHDKQKQRNPALPATNG